MTIPLQIFESLDSTNAEGKRQLQSNGLNHPFVIVTKQQTAGRGTQGRTWVNAPNNGGLMFSLVMPNVLPNHKADLLPLSPHITQIVAVACAKYFHKHYTVPLAIKPVNDLMLPLQNQPNSYGKAGGILVESIVQGSNLLGYVIGIGLNWWAAPTLPSDDINTATAITDNYPKLSALTTEAIVGPLCGHIQAESTHQLTSENPNWQARYQQYCISAG